MDDVKWTWQQSSFGMTMALADAAYLSRGLPRAESQIILG